MPGRNRYSAAILLLLLSPMAAEAAEKSVVACTSGELVRRVVVEVGDLGTGLPCEVIYWKDKEAPGERRVLWNAQSDSGFCDKQAAGLVDKLATAGWSCDAGGGATSAQVNPAAIEPAAPAPSEPRQNATNAGSRGTAPGETTDLAALPSPTQTPEPPAPGNATQNQQSAALAPATSSAAAPVDQLETVIQANLASLNETVDGDFKATIGDFGDLNSDGIDDAVVFFNYESSTADFTQFVAAYLYDGDNYLLAATKPVGGTDLAVRKVEVENIVDGAIQLKLELNDASQAGDKRAAMILKDGQLIETE